MSFLEHRWTDGQILEVFGVERQERDLIKQGLLEVDRPTELMDFKTALAHLVANAGAPMLSHGLIAAAINAVVMCPIELEHWRTSHLVLSHKFVGVSTGDKTIDKNIFNLLDVYAEDSLDSIVLVNCGKWVKRMEEYYQLHLVGATEESDVESESV